MAQEVLPSSAQFRDLTPMICTCAYGGTREHSRPLRVPLSTLDCTSAPGAQRNVVSHRVRLMHIGASDIVVQQAHFECAGFYQSALLQAMV